MAGPFIEAGSYASTADVIGLDHADEHAQMECRCLLADRA